MKRYLYAITLLLLLTACSTDTDIGYGDNEGAANENIEVGYGTNDRTPAPEAWIMLDAAASSFTVYAPAAWVETPEQGIDSYIGTISGDGVTLRYDYGMYSGEFSRSSEYNESEYDVLNTAINGFEAVIYTPKVAGKGNTVLNVMSPRGEGNLNLYGENLSAEQQEIVVEIFKTVFFAQ